MERTDELGLRNRVIGLTESQRTCLRFVAQGMTSKEISARTGLSPSTIDTYLKTAVSLLGASNRREAARRFAEIATSQQLGSQSATVAPPEVLPETPSQPVDGGAPVAAPQSLLGLFKPPPIGGAANELDAKARIVEMLRIACLMAVVTSALVLFALGAIRALS